MSVAYEEGKAHFSKGSALELQVFSDWLGKQDLRNPYDDEYNDDDGLELLDDLLMEERERT